MIMQIPRKDMFYSKGAIPGSPSLPGLILRLLIGNVVAKKWSLKDENGFAADETFHKSMVEVSNAHVL
jgi:hypothetical protein